MHPELVCEILAQIAARSLVCFITARLAQKPVRTDFPVKF